MIMKDVAQNIMWPCVKQELYASGT